MVDDDTITLFMTANVNDECIISNFSHLRRTKVLSLYTVSFFEKKIKKSFLKML